MRQLRKRSEARLLLCMVLLVLLAGMVGCARRPASEVSLRLKWIIYAGWAGELVAADRGLWSRQGINVDMAPGGFELDPIKLVAAGTDDIGVAGADQILLAREKGIPLIAFATQYQVSPVGFVSMRGSGIQSPADFRGKRIGVKYGTDVEPLYRALLAKAGLTADDVDEVPVKFDLSPFFVGAVDVYPGYLTSDLLIPEERGFQVDVIRATDHGVTVYGNVYFCTEEYLESNPEVLVSFLRGVSEGWEAALQMDPDELAQLAVAANPELEPAHEARVAGALSPYIVPAGVSFGEMSPAGWRALYELLRAEGVLEGEIDISAAYTGEILERVGIE